MIYGLSEIFGEITLCGKKNGFQSRKMTLIYAAQLLEETKKKKGRFKCRKTKLKYQENKCMSL